ncbi:Sec7 domain-containing protein [Rickettsia endosymbiont of Cantharis rufa]|uniref:Sec7 domain-containing protein n=1 Tax=Rickettsia endosymbiont of Cantharis rufa TaxID=3066248 RepID=UPI0031333F07
MISQKAESQELKNGVLIIIKILQKKPLNFFYEEKNNLNLEFVGDYLGTDGGDNKKVLESFTKQFNF